MSPEFEDLKARYERLKLLYDVGNVIHSTLDPQSALRLIVAEAVRLMQASSGSVSLVNPTNGFLEIHASNGLPEEATRLKLRLGEGITGWVAQTGESARVGDVRKDSRYVSARSGVLSELAIPLEVDGEVRGVLNVDSDRSDAFTASDQELLQELALQASKVIHNTWLFEQTRLKAQWFESLLNVGGTINSTVGLDEALKVVTREACLLMGGKMSSLLMISGDPQWLELKASFGAGPPYQNKPKLSAAESLVGIVMRRKKPLQVENVQSSSLYQNVKIARQEGLVALLSVPLVFSGQAFGVLNVYTAQPHTFSNEEIRILLTLADLSAIAIEKARLYERIVEVEEQLRKSEKLSALGLLAAEVAHEIRNPLTVMKMMYHALDLNFPPDDPRAKDAQILGEKMDHLNRIMEQILDFARRTEPALSKVNLTELIEDLGLLTRFKLANQNIRLDLELEPQLWPLLADRTQLEQAFLNLTLNAVEAMARGGILTIRARNLPAAGQAGPEVAIEIEDTGTGMTKQECEGAFSSFLRTKKIKGTGLGLAIVARVVEAHRGKIAIKSEPGCGTTIAITLPVHPS